MQVIISNFYMKIEQLIISLILLTASTCFSETLYIENWIDEKTYEMVLQSKSSVDTVHIKNCSGGQVLPSLKIAIEIRARKINTVAEGHVFSACSNVFLGGVYRTISTGASSTVIAFHGTFFESGLEPGAMVKPGGAAKSRIVLDILKKNLNFEFTAPVKEIILNTQEIFEAAYFVFDKNSNGIAMHCKGTEKLDPSTCKLIKNVNAFNEKIITSRK